MNIFKVKIMFKKTKFSPVAMVIGILGFLAFFECGGPKRLVPPRVASDIKLDYPLSAQLKKLEGEVGIAVFVNPEGRPEQTELVQSSGHAELDEAALKFTQNLIFEPGALDGKPIGAWTKLLLRYNLSEVVFDKNNWLYDVQNLLAKANQADTTGREETLRKLYVQYIGMLNFAANMTDVSINHYIRTVITKEVEKNWRDFWNEYAVAFVLLDDFICRFPDSRLVEQARQDLIRKMLDLEFEIRLRSLRSSRLSQRSSDLINKLEEKIKSLQEYAIIRAEEP